MKKKAHHMQTRNPEKYLVQKALNDRLKKSPIIYMQKNNSSEFLCMHGCVVTVALVRYFNCTFPYLISK